MGQLVKQRGLSAVSLLIVLLVSAFFLNCAIRLIPLYVDNMTVRSALNSLAKEPTLSTMRKSQLKRKVNDYFNVNNMQDNLSQSISIEETPKTVLVNVNYEERVSIIFNIDAVVVFKNQLDVNNPDLCCDPQWKN